MSPVLHMRGRGAGSEQMVQREEQSREYEGEGVAVQLCHDWGCAGGWQTSTAPSCLELLSSPPETSRSYIVTPKTFLLPKG